MAPRMRDVERAGVLVLQRGRLALIERSWAGSRYWVVPGGGVEVGERALCACRQSWYWVATQAVSQAAPQAPSIPGDLSSRRGSDSGQASYAPQTTIWAWAGPPMASKTHPVHRGRFPAAGAAETC